jgi:hypothetical protein
LYDIPYKNARCNFKKKSRKLIKRGLFEAKNLLFAFGEVKFHQN